MWVISSMIKARFLFKSFAYARPVVASFLAASLVAACGLLSDEPKPASRGDVAALPFSIEVPYGFSAFNARRDGLVLHAKSSAADKVVPTIEVDIHLDIASRNFSPEKLVLDRWPELADYGYFRMNQPVGATFVGKQGIVISGVAVNSKTNNSIYVEQWVSKQDEGYARLVAFADLDRFGELRSEIHAIARSIEIKEGPIWEDEDDNTSKQRFPLLSN